MTTADAGTYRRLDESLKAHRGDEKAYARLGAQMRARRHLLDPRFGNRRLFVRERLVSLGLKETAAYKLAYDLEQGTLQGRGGFSAGNMLVLAQAYGTTADSVIRVLGGGELGPLPESGRHARQRTPETPGGQWLPPLDSGTIDQARPHADAIWMRLRELALQGIANPSGGEVLPGDYADASDWDRRAGTFSVEERIWLTATLRAREEARDRGRGTGTRLAVCSQAVRIIRHPRIRGKTLPCGHDLPRRRKYPGAGHLPDREMSHTMLNLLVGMREATVVRRDAGQRKSLGRTHRMMPGVARDDAAAGTGEALAVRRIEMDNLEVRFAGLMEHLAANPAFPGQDRRMTALIAAYRADRKALIDLMFAVELDETEREKAYQRGHADGLAAAARTPGRHRRRAAASLPQRALRVVTAIPAGLTAAADVPGARDPQGARQAARCRRYGVAGGRDVFSAAMASGPVVVRSA
jgi:hypothetical protein